MSKKKKEADNEAPKTKTKIYSEQEIINLVDEIESKRDANALLSDEAMQFSKEFNLELHSFAGAKCIAKILQAQEARQKAK